MARLSLPQTLLWNLFFLLTLVLLPEAADSEIGAKAKYVHTLKVRFFSTVSMTCDHPLLNVSTDPDVTAISWVFPDGSNVASASNVNPRLYTFSAAEGGSRSLDLYNLTALEIDDIQFGYYFCVVEFESRSKQAVAIRWGLNVNGADFSDLLKTYRENAIVGGAAAAALLLVIGGGCLLWNFRFGNRDSLDPEDDDDPKVGVDRVASVHHENNERKFNNAAYKDDEEDRAVIDVHM